MLRSARSLFRFQTLNFIVIGCLAFFLAGGQLQADNRGSGQTTDSSSPILFDGWRRTTNGWERLPLKDSRRSINDWIASQKEEEADNPLVQPLQRLGQVHPIRIAAGELALACLIAFVASDRRVSEKGGESAKRGRNQ